MIRECNEVLFFHLQCFVIAVTVKYGGISNTYRLKWIVGLEVDLNDSQVNCLILVKPNLK